MRKVVNLFAIPALVIHEFSHMVAIILLGAKGTGVGVKGKLDSLEVVVNYDTNSNLKKNIISMAPIAGFIAWLTFMMFTSGVTFMVLAIYTALYVRVFLPSKFDLLMYQTQLIPNEMVEGYEIPELD